MHDILLTSTLRLIIVNNHNYATSFHVQTLFWVYFYIIKHYIIIIQTPKNIYILCKQGKQFNNVNNFKFRAGRHNP